MPSLVLAISSSYSATEGCFSWNSGGSISESTMKTSIGQCARQSGGADFFRQPHAPVDFHGARVAPFHLRQELRRFLLLDQRAGNAAQAEIDGQGQSGRAGADDEDGSIHNWRGSRGAAIGQSGHRL